MVITSKQLAALRHLQVKGAESPWMFGSTTVNRLRLHGLVEDFVANGAKHLRLTPAGVAYLGSLRSGTP